MLLVRVLELGPQPVERDGTVERRLRARNQSNRRGEREVFQSEHGGDSNRCARQNLRMSLLRSC